MRSWDDFKISQNSNYVKFGLCDDDDVSKGADPAYLCENEQNIESNWIANIQNEKRADIFFAPIDKCSLVPSLSNGKESKQCDGILRYENTIAFIELKNRNDHSAKKWINLGIAQLIVTINHFEQFEFISTTKFKKAYIANKKKPYAHSSEVMRSEKFKDKVGYVLRIRREIEIK